MDVRNTSIEELKSKLTGTVMSVGDPQYDDAREVWNAMIDRKPAVIARCRNTEDVRRSVRFASEQGLPIAIRGGGHNVAGHAVG